MNDTLQTDALTDQSELTKLAAFVAPTPEVAGIKIRPLSAGTVIQLKLTRNPFADGIDPDDIEDREYQTAAFIYIHAGDPDEVRKAVFDPEGFKLKVLAFAEKLSIPDFINVGEQIKKLIESASIAQDYEVKPDGNHAPNF